MASSKFSTVTKGRRGPKISSCMTLSEALTPLSRVRDMYRDFSSGEGEGGGGRGGGRVGGGNGKMEQLQDSHSSGKITTCIHER